MCGDEGVYGIGIEIFIFGACDRILISAYHFMVEVEVFDGVDCELIDD